MRSIIITEDYATYILLVLAEKHPILQVPEEIKIEIMSLSILWLTKDFGSAVNLTPSGKRFVEAIKDNIIMGQAIAELSGIAMHIVSEVEGRQRWRWWRRFRYGNGKRPMPMPKGLNLKCSLPDEDE